MNFKQKIFQLIQKHQLIKAGDVVVVGVSGGADSMALVHVLAGLRHALGVQLHVAHFNHNMRSEAIEDQRFVQQCCRRWNIPLTLGQRRGRREAQFFSEDQARRMRFEFFVRLAKQLKAKSVALAHTEDDLAETVLMRLMRGAGLYGLRGILPIRRIEGVEFIRPLITVGRKDVERYLKTCGITFCTDATNRQTVYARNKIRLKLLPLLAKEYNPQMTHVLASLARTAQEDYEFLAGYARKRFKKNVVVSRGKIKVELDKIRREHPAIQRLMIRQMAGVLTGDPAVLTFQHMHELEDLLIQRPCGSVVHLPHKLCAVKHKKYLELSHA